MRVQICLLFVLCLMLSTAKADLVLDQSHESSSAFGASSAYSIIDLAQTFRVGISGRLDAIDLRVYSLNGPTDWLSLDIVPLDASGIPIANNTSSIASTKLASSSVPTIFAYFGQSVDRPFTRFDFSGSNLVVQEGQLLAMLLRSTTPVTNGYLWDYGDGTYVNGRALVRNFSQTGNWEDSQSDFQFRTIVSVPEPSSIVSVGLIAIFLVWRRVSP